MEDNKDKKNNQNEQGTHLPTKDEMIEYIYEVIADKTLSFGCLLTWGFIFDANKSVMTEYGERFDDGPEIQQEEIKGHPVMIGDVLDWMGKNGYFYFCNHNKHVQFKGFEPIFNCEGVRSEEEKKRGRNGTGIYCKSNDYQTTLGNLREEKRKTIYEQSEDCIKFVYSLIPAKQKTV